MKQPVEGTEWPQASSLRWFVGKTFSTIADNTDLKFSQQLRQNVMRVVTKTNHLLNEKIDAWQYMRPQKDLFGIFFKAVISVALSEDPNCEVNFTDRYQILTFFNYAFNSIEVDFVHEQIRRYLPLSILINLPESRRNLELSKLSKRIKLAWNRLEQQDKQLDPEILRERHFERKFVFNYVRQFLTILQTAVGVATEEKPSDEEAERAPVLVNDVALYCQRFVEFVIDIESQLPLRRFFNALLDYTHFIVRCQLSGLARHKSAEGQLFNQLVELLHLYSRYDIDVMTGESFSEADMLRKHEQDILSLQKVFWSKYECLRRYATKPVKAIDNPSALYKIVTSFDNKEELFGFLKSTGLADENSMNETDRSDAPLMASILMNRYRRHESQMKKINSIPLFPNESVIWDTNLVPDQYYNYEYPLALPKLNLQFLTMSDYLLRNFMLFKNESTYSIRQDLEEGIKRSKCRWTAENTFATGPKQRMALIIKQFSLCEVCKPNLGEKCPSKVRAKIIINMDYVCPEWRREWEQLRKRDTCFLVSFRKPSDKDELGWPAGTFPAKNYVKYVRGCEIEGLLDSNGKIVDENLETPKFSDNLRTFLVWLDCNQYQMDQDALINRKSVVYDKFHLIVRRKPENNNFKGVLETIRHLMNSKFVVPDWLKNLLIGFGDPHDADPARLRSSTEYTLDYHDTFLNYDHLVETFRVLLPYYDIKSKAESDALHPPFRVNFNEDLKELTVIPYVVSLRGPYPKVAPKKNLIKFTPAQVQAVTSGLQNGLTMVVGPPGTGKTDVAVQILSALYHSDPTQRTLIVAHSNQALNQIFSKMIELDVQEHHLLRMGHGEEDLDSTKDFSRQGRVKHVLQKRLELLVIANKLARSLDLDPGQGMSCQSAQYFFSYHIKPRWDKFIDCVKNSNNIQDVGGQFPFTKFFSDAPQPLFKSVSFEEDIEIANGCFKYIDQIFDQLQAFRPFEIFNNASDRSKYLLIREAKIIAMTCTHAGLRRKELVEMNFQYDNILMEETAQILEIETTIPLLLQNPENGVNRLKRWIMIGDHNQLPPIIQNSAFQKFSNMEQSLFARFVRLGVPYIELDAQGRARDNICDLYRWRYRNLRDLSFVHSDKEFKQANAGFAQEYQLINVDDYKGAGESTPMPYYYQNRGEAEYVVAVYRFMRLIGYPSEKITILTTYNGQKQLLRDLIEQECAKDALIGKPSKVTTVDKFQGQQNDYILLSLVRTRTVGHVRDIRRLVVAMSRARLGLYIFARVSLFAASLELQHSMKFLLARPQTLQLILNEIYPTARNIGQLGSSQHLRVIKTPEEMQQLVAELYTNMWDQQSRLSHLNDDDTSSSSDNTDGLIHLQQTADG